MIAEYSDCIDNAASSIFLNFYRSDMGQALLNETETSDIIVMLSKYHKKEFNDVERDISEKVHDIVKRIPFTYLAPTTKIVYH